MCLTNAALYARVRILGQLECCSPLHVGDGSEQLFRDRKGRNDPPGSYRAICLAADGRPYIPATTLRGHLRDRCDPALACQLFGHLSDNGNNAGKVHLFDAYYLRQPEAVNSQPYWDADRKTAIQHGIALKPITGTVDPHRLFRHEIIPVGTRFSLELEAHDLDHDALVLLLGLLSGLNGGPNARVGRGASRMQGRLRWSLERIDYLDHKALLAWLEDAEGPLNKAYRPLRTEPTTISPPQPPGHQIRIRLHPTGPLLINEPGFVTNPARRRNQATSPQDEANHGPDLEYSRTPDGRAKIPASSLRGLLRARARRILLTLATAQVPYPLSSQVGDHLLGRLFGATGRRSRIWTSDAIAGRPCDPIDQTFVAIDRFTGGGERHKLYQARAARCGPLTADIRLDTRWQELADWEKALLLLLARDALEGDLAVGWGKSRGYGALEVEIEWTDRVTFSHWTHQNQGLLDHIYAHPAIGQNGAQSWIVALHQEIDTVAKALKSQTMDEE